MYDFLIKLFVKDNNNVHDAKVREQYGKLGSITGIIVNIILFVSKFIVGLLFYSISITGDAINNLSDAGSSIISLISFKMSGKPADSKHPFGHARIEYIASFAVSLIILLIGYEFLKTSIDKILNPGEIEFSLVMIIILGISILLKLWLYRFNIKLGNSINSTVMHATAADSLSDVLSTLIVLISAVLSPMIGFQLDGYMGVVISIFIMISGIKILKETMDIILGQAPSDALTDHIISFIKRYDDVIGIHDLVVHDYGPNRCFASVHVEVDAKADILQSHDLIDNIERDIAQESNIYLVIHLDPIVTDDPFVNKLHDMTKEILESVDKTLTMHDFRVVKGTTHSNLIFDVTVPYECKKEDSKIIDEISSRIRDIDKRYYAVITIDRSYVSSTKNKILSD